MTLSSQVTTWSTPRGVDLGSTSSLREMQAMSPVNPPSARCRCPSFLKSLRKFLVKTFTFKSSRKARGSSWKMSHPERRFYDRNRVRGWGSNRVRGVGEGWTATRGTSCHTRRRLPAAPRAWRQATGGHLSLSWFCRLCAALGLLDNSVRSSSMRFSRAEYYAQSECLYRQGGRKAVCPLASIHRYLRQADTMKYASGAFVY